MGSRISLIALGPKAIEAEMANSYLGSLLRLASSGKDVACRIYYSSSLLNHQSLKEALETTDGLTASASSQLQQTEFVDIDKMLEINCEEFPTIKQFLLKMQELEMDALSKQTPREASYCAAMADLLRLLILFQHVSSEDSKEIEYYLDWDVRPGSRPLRELEDQLEPTTNLFIPQPFCIIANKNSVHQLNSILLIIDEGLHSLENAKIAYLLKTIPAQPWFTQYFFTGAILGTLANTEFFKQKNLQENITQFFSHQGDRSYFTHSKDKAELKKNEDVIINELHSCIFDPKQVSNPEVTLAYIFYLTFKPKLLIPLKHLAENYLYQDSSPSPF